MLWPFYFRIFLCIFNISNLNFVHLIFKFISYFSGTFVVVLFYFILLINLFCYKFSFHLFYSVLLITSFIFLLKKHSRHKMFVLMESSQMECREQLHKKVACLHVIFISQHFDWVLRIISKCD